MRRDEANDIKTKKPNRKATITPISSNSSCIIMNIISLVFLTVFLLGEAATASPADQGSSSGTNLRGNTMSRNLDTDNTTFYGWKCIVYEEGKFATWHLDKTENGVISGRSKTLDSLPFEDGYQTFHNYMEWTNEPGTQLKLSVNWYGLNAVKSITINDNFEWIELCVYNDNNKNVGNCIIALGDASEGTDWWDDHDPAHPHSCHKIS